MAKALFRENSPKQLAWENSWLVSLCIDPGVLRISSDGDDRMGAKTKTQNDPKKIPGPKYLPNCPIQKNPSIENFKPPKILRSSQNLKSGIPLWNWPLKKDRRNNNTDEMCHYTDLGSAADWSCHKGKLLQAIRSTPRSWQWSHTISMEFIRHFSDIILQESQLWKLWQHDFSL